MLGRNKGELMNGSVGVKRGKVALVVASVVLSCSMLTPAGAQVPAKSSAGLPVVLRPSDAHGNVVSELGYFMVAAMPGTTLHEYVLVGNESRKRTNVSVVPVDAVSGEYGGVSYNLSYQPRLTVGKWVHLPQTSLQID